MRRLIISLILLFFGCVPVPIADTFEIKTTYDKFEERTFVSMHNNFLDTRELYHRSIALNAGRMETKDGKKSYNLVIVYSGSDWLFIRSGESLIFLIDGKRLGLSGPGSSGHRDVRRYGGITELAFYPTTLETIKRIAVAKIIEIKIIGKYYITGRFYQSNFDNFKRFLAECEK